MAQNISVRGVVYNGIRKLKTDLASGSGKAIFRDTTEATITDSDVLYGKQAFGPLGEVTGSMPNNGDVSDTISERDETIEVPLGYTDGGTISISSTEKAKLIPDNIKSGVTILGVHGNSDVVDTESSAPASAAQILSGREAYVNGVKVVGTMPNNYSIYGDIFHKDIGVSIPLGYTDGGTVELEQGERNKIIPGNIRAGVNILGVNGNQNVINTQNSKAAVASEIISGKEVYANGSKIVGSMPDNGNVSNYISTKNGTVNIPLGYTDGGTVEISNNEKQKIISSNIRAGVTMLGVTGSSDVINTASNNAAVADEIIVGKEAYVNGVKVTGALPIITISQDVGTKILSIL